MNSPSPSSDPESPTSCHHDHKKRTFLNKFLTKTYHCISECDPSIAAWSNGGRSFTIKDVDAFEKIVLPKYFNHSRFDSFIRQLNFYSFHKSRSDPDLQLNSKAVRYSHEFFRQGEPELLRRITRSTAAKPTHAGADLTTNHLISTLQQQIGGLQKQIQDAEVKANEKIEAEARRLEIQYSARIQNLETLLALLIPQSQRRVSLTPPSTTSHWETAGSLADLADYIRSNQTK